MGFPIALILAWPNGVQEELSQPVAVLLNESNETLAIASQAGYRFFTSIEDFRRYVDGEILAGEPLTPFHARFTAKQSGGATFR
jgi:hypothetical protein